MAENPFRSLGIPEFSSPRTINNAVEKHLADYQQVLETRRKRALNATKAHEEEKCKTARFTPGGKIERAIRIKRSDSSSSSSSRTTESECAEGFQRAKNSATAERSTFEFDNHPREEFFEDPHVARTASNFNKKKFRAATTDPTENFEIEDSDDDEKNNKNHFDRERIKKVQAATKSMTSKVQIRDMKRLCNITQQLTALRAVLEGKLMAPLVMFKCDGAKADSFVADKKGVVFTRSQARKNALVSNSHFRATASSAAGVLVDDLSSNGTFYKTSNTKAKLQVPKQGVHILLSEAPIIVVAEIEFSVEPVLDDRAKAIAAAELLFKALMTDKAPITLDGIRFSGIGREIRRWSRSDTEFKGRATDLLAKYMSLASSENKK